MARQRECNDFSKTFHIVEKSCPLSGQSNPNSFVINNNYSATRITYTCGKMVHKKSLTETLILVYTVIDQTIKAKMQGDELLERNNNK